jgi:hypothetical protein
MAPDESMPRNAPSTTTPARFSPGQLVATPTALSVLVSLKVSPWSLLDRHVHGDWGDLDEHDQWENERALLAGERLLSAYTLPDGTRLWIITEADRSATMLLLPNEY